MPAMPQTASPQAASERLPLAGRAMEIGQLQRTAQDAASDAPLATATITWTTGARVQRYDWKRDRMYLEELAVTPEAVRLDRLTKGAPLLNSHSSYELRDVLGVIEAPQIADGRGTATVVFSRRADVAPFVQDVADGIIRNVSVGYARYRMEMIAPEREGDPWVYRVTDWEPMEVSLVPIPADMDAQVQRSAGNVDGSNPQQPDTATRTFACEVVEIVRRSATGTDATQTPTVGDTAATPTNRKDSSMPGAQDAGGNPTPAASTTDAVAAALQRAADITDLCQRHKVTDLAAGLIRDGKSLDEARAAVLSELASRDAATGGQRNVVTVTTVQDEHETRMAGIQNAIMHRLDSKAELTDNGRQYRGLSLLEIGRDYLAAQGVNVRGLDKLTIATKMLHQRTGGHMGTGDFSNLMANVANKRLRNRYQAAAATYDVWARRAPNAPDFKNIQVTSLSGAPELLQTNEHGEFKYGSMSDGAETYAVVTYGRIVSLTRQAIINDDLRGFDRLVGAFGESARRLENRLVYAQLTANANLSDGGALFNSTAVTTAGGHANLTTTASSALQLSALQAARLAMRKQVGLAGEVLNIAPQYLIVPAALESTAYQLTSNAYVPAVQSNINEFAAGGPTALTTIVEPLLDASSATAWYLAANSGQIDTVEYCYLDGAEGPMIESEIGFEVDGISYKCREDFAAKAIDFRGLHKAAGA